MRIRVYSFVTCLGLLAFTLPAQAQTWRAPRTTPLLEQLVAVDATGEPDWIYGAEDVAGDGLDNFRQQEQSLDIRTAYASADNQYFWVRVYVSEPNAVGSDIGVYVFIDSDDDASSGGTAEAPEIAADFANDPTSGGYDFVLGLDGNETVAGLWAWNDANSLFEPVTLTEDAARAETGSDTDPVLLNGAEHGYLQGIVELDVVQITTSCQSNVYVRSISNTGSPGSGASSSGDLDVGLRAACIPADANDDGIADVADSEDRCETDAQCPAGGVCVNGRCVFPRLCEGDGDCAADESCLDGRCVADGGDACTDDGDCDGLVCMEGACMTCSTDGMCAGGRCGPDGRCTTGSGTSSMTDEGIQLEPDEEVQGGALTCAWGQRADGKAAYAWLGFGAVLLFRRRLFSRQLASRQCGFGR